MYPEFNTRCKFCQIHLVRSRARGVFEGMVFLLGGDIGRCLSCGARFLCYRRFKIPTRAHTGYATNGADDRAYMIAGIAIFTGILTWLGIALWILHRFHRWPF